MNGGLVISIAIFTFLEVVRTEYVRAFGVESKESTAYVLLVAAMLILAFLCFPDEQPK